MAKKKQPKVEEQIPIMILTNERTPFKAQQILMLYKAASIGQLAYVDALNPETGIIEPLLAGLEPTGEGNQMRVYPLAKLISKIDELPAYLIPDGQGNYMDAGIGNGKRTEPAPEEGTTSEG